MYICTNNEKIIHKDMSLDQTKIVANTKKYFETATNLGFMTDELQAFLGTDFIKAPASTVTKLHNAFEGGLIAHLLNVAKYAVMFNNALPADEKVDQNSLLKVALLHQIGKAKLYIANDSEWHKKNLGQMYKFNEDLVSMRVSDRSIFYASAHGVTFTEEEYQAIIMFDREDDKMVEYHNSTMGDLLKVANLFAIKNEKANK